MTRQSELTGGILTERRNAAAGNIRAPVGLSADEAKKIVALSYLPVSYRRLLEFLEIQPANLQECANHLGMTPSSTQKVIEILRVHKVVRIEEYYWDADGRRKWRWGLGRRDVPVPEKKTPAQRSKSWRERRKAPTLGVWGL